MFRATMPETAIHKNRDFFVAENEVGASDDRLMAPPTDDPVLSQDLHKPQFGLLIASGPNLGHNARTGRRRKDVSHSRI